MDSFIVMVSYWFQHVIMRWTNQIIPNKLRLCFHLPQAPFLILLCIFMVHVQFVLIVRCSLNVVSYGLEIACAMSLLSSSCRAVDLRSHASSVAMPCVPCFAQLGASSLCFLCPVSVFLFCFFLTIISVFHYFILNFQNTPDHVNVSLVSFFRQKKKISFFSDTQTVTH